MGIQKNKKFIVQNCLKSNVDKITNLFENYQGSIYRKKSIKDPTINLASNTKVILEESEHPEIFKNYFDNTAENLNIKR